MGSTVRKKTRPKSAALAGNLCNVPCFKENVVQSIQNKLPPDEVLADIRSLFSAMADQARLKILYALSQSKELCVCDVAHVIGMSVSTTSHHLRKLRDLKLLKYRNDGKMAYYAIRNQFAARLVADALKETGEQRGK